MKRSEVGFFLLKLPAWLYDFCEMEHFSFVNPLPNLENIEIRVLKCGTAADRRRTAELKSLSNMSEEDVVAWLRQALRAGERTNIVVSITID
jgi:hypothetical protein